MITTIARATPWLVLILALGLATMPVWRFLLLGFSPGLDDLLSIVCTGSRS